MRIATEGDRLVAATSADNATVLLTDRRIIELVGDVQRTLSLSNSLRKLRWPRLFGQNLRWDKWIVCRG
jgi:hypothetical protein